MSGKRKHEDDENVHQSEETSAHGPTSAIESATATADRLHSSSVLELLPNVLLHVCMQLLEFASLARLSRTCRFMRSATLHRSAGRFIDRPPVDSLLPMRKASFLNIYSLNHPTRSSQLFQAHMPVSLQLPSTYAEFAAALQQQSSLFQRIRTIDAKTCGEEWTEQQVLELLHRPQSRGVISVTFLHSNRVWLQSVEVQRAVCQLPHLTQLGVDVVDQDPHADGVEPVRVDPAAIALAANLTHMDVCIAPGQVSELAFLAAASHLTRLELSADNYGHLYWSDLAATFPSTLRQLRCLRLESFNVSIRHRAAHASFFRCLPNLHTLELRCIDSSAVMRGLMEAGVESLSSLRLIELGWGSILRKWLPSSVVRRFLHRFPAVHLMILVDNDESVADIAAAYVNFSGWPRVTIQQQHTGPPSPHASDDEEEQYSSDSEEEEEDEEGEHVEED